MSDIWSEIGAGTPFNLTDCKVALWSSEGSFGAAEDVAAITSFEVTADVVSGMLEGDGGVVANASFSQRATGSLTFGGIPIDMWAIISGSTKKSGGSTPNRYESIPLVQVGQCYPYFAICGRSTTENCASDVHVWIPKAKIESIGTVTLAKGAFVQANIEFMAISDGTTYEAVEWVTHETATDVTIPVTYITS